MARALDLARAQLGKTSPNPSVGCVIVADGAIVGEGATGNGGRPHAEEIALDSAGERAEGATAYVTLEPCNQRSGGSFSCSQLLLGAGVARVVIACPDPHPLGAHGADRLTASGVDGRDGPDARRSRTPQRRLLQARRDRPSAGSRSTTMRRPMTASSICCATRPTRRRLIAWAQKAGRASSFARARRSPRSSTRAGWWTRTPGLASPHNEKRAGHLGRPVSKFVAMRRPREAASAARLEGLDLRRGHLAGALVLLELEAHALAFVEAGESCTLDSRDVNEHIRAALLRLDEAVALLLVEPFDSTGSHVDLVFR